MQTVEINPAAQRPLTVVVADDDPAICQLVRAILSRTGCRVITACTGIDAIARTKEVRPDLVILDYVMPDMDGARAAELLRAGEDTGHIPLLLLSAVAGDPQSEKISDKLWDATVAKPFSPAALRSAVAAATNRADALREEMNSVRETIGDAARAMQSEYVHSLVQSLRDIRASLAAATQNGDPYGHIESARRRCHQIRGSAGTFGLANIGRIAAEAEEQLTRALDDVDGVPNVARLAGVATAVEAMESRLSEVNAPGLTTRDSDVVSEVAPHILIIDETAHIAPKIRRLARERGYFLEAVDSRERAEQRLSEQFFAVVSVGGEIANEGDCSWIASLPRKGNCGSVLLVGGGGSIQHRVAAAHAGVNLYLAGKPEPARLLEAWHGLVDTVSPRVGRVLIVDDDPMLQDFERRQLEMAGCEVSSLEDPAGVFERLDAFEPHLLVLDVDMPSACGLDVARAVRAAERWAHIPILIQTAHTDPQYRRMAFESGADDFITKPVIEDELLVRVLGRLERARLTRELAEQDPVTGLYNLRSFLARAAKAKAGQATTVAAIVEVEGLTEFARRHGLEAADAALSGVADGLQGAFRSPNSVLGRVGAAVLGVFSAGSGVEEVTARLEHCLERLEEDPRVSPAGDPARELQLEVALTGLDRGVDVAEGIFDALRSRRPRRLGHVVDVSARAAVACDSVFVVEADDDLREMLCHALRQAGYAVTSFDEGPEAVDSLLRHDVRGRRVLVVVDVDLADSNGLDILAHLERERPGEFRTIVLAADGTERRRMQALRAGAAEYLVKPVKLGQFLDAVARLGRSH